MWVLDITCLPCGIFEKSKSAIYVNVFSVSDQSQQLNTLFNIERIII